MKFIDLFAGIGGFRLGMEAAGHECVAFCEIDKFARASYKAIFDTEGEIEFHDITRVSDESVRGIGSVDVICGGFPCQAFSTAGKRRGFEDTSCATVERQVVRLGNINPSGNGMNGEVYQADGLAPTLTTNKGEGQKIAIPVMPHAPTLRTMQRGGNEPKIIQRSHGYNQGGEHDIAPTLTSNSWQENNVLKIREAVSSGYVEATVGDSVNLAFPNSTTSRGRVGKGIANTVLTGGAQGVVVYDFYNKSAKNEVGTLTASGHQGNTRAGTFQIVSYTNKQEIV